MFLCINNLCTMNIGVQWTTTTSFGQIIKSVDFNVICTCSCGQLKKNVLRAHELLHEGVRFMSCHHIFAAVHHAQLVLLLLSFSSGYYTHTHKQNPNRYTWLFAAKGMISVNVFWILNIRIVSRKADECVFVSVHRCGAVWHGGNYIQRHLNHCLTIVIKFPLCIQFKCDLFPRQYFCFLSLTPGFHPLSVDPHLIKPFSLVWPILMEYIWLIWINNVRKRPR